MSETKIILDACCGSRMFWFDKENPLTLFADIRDEEHTLCDGRSLKIHPDIVSDFTDMPFLEESFKLVVFDPPHLLKVGKDSWLAKKYGKLPEDWPRLIKKGVDECFRVLEDYGVLIFKWNEDQITVREVLKAINRQPLFGHTTGRHGKTMWMCFMKLPINVKQNRKEQIMSTHTIKTSLRGLKRWAWRKNLSGFFSVNGKELSDEQARTMVEWAIKKGYEYDADIPEEEVIELLKLNL